jgi:RNA polymerase sigma-32 factor
MDFIADKTPNQEDAYANKETYVYRKELFNKAINVLNPREKDILFKRRLSYSPDTLEELSGVYHISKERVRQIELNSIRKLRNNIYSLQ